MRIYVASSWRNPYQQDVVKTLRKLGHEVYDFRNPKPGNTGFHWSEVGEDWLTWTPEKFRTALEHPMAYAGFFLDRDACEKADRTILVLPSGRSAHLEAGRSKEFDVFMPVQCEPELMYKWARKILVSRYELVEEYRQKGET